MVSWVSPSVSQGEELMLSILLRGGQAGNLASNYVLRPDNVDLSYAAVNQEWKQMIGVMKFTTTIMLPTLELFVVESGNGMWLFAADI